LRESTGDNHRDSFDRTLVETAKTLMIRGLRATMDKRLPKDSPIPEIELEKAALPDNISVPAGYTAFAFSIKTDPKRETVVLLIPNNRMGQPDFRKEGRFGTLEDLREIDN
jgi:hypothetical protein